MKRGFLSELARKTGVSTKHIYCVLTDKTRPSYDFSVVLEKVTGINRLAWIDAKNFFNPEKPSSYKGPWPPDLSHLWGEALERAQRIIAENPAGPPPPRHRRPTSSPKPPGSAPRGPRSNSNRGGQK